MELTIAKLSWLGSRTCFTSVPSSAAKGYCEQAGEKESVKEDRFPSVSDQHPSQTTESQRRNVLLIPQKATGSG